jgi:hypothetical protein
VSLWWIPIRNMSFGIEYVWGERKNLALLGILA